MTWPTDKDVRVTSRGYETPDGLKPRVTTILKVLGLGTDALIRWSADLERDAVLEAAGDVYAHGEHGTPDEFVSAVRARVGPARQHQRKLSKAADIGSSIHNMIQWTLKGELGEKQGPKPQMPEEAAWAFMAWKAWWAGARLVPVRIEQPVWTDRYAGTVDLIARAEDGALEVWDWKSGKGIYESYHLQVAAYAAAASRFAGEPVLIGGIVRVPKVVGDPDVEVRRVGDCRYDYKDRDGVQHKGGTDYNYAQLMEGFNAALTLYEMFAKEAK